MKKAFVFVPKELNENNHKLLKENVCNRIKEGKDIWEVPLNKTDGESLETVFGLPVKSEYEINQEVIHKQKVYSITAISAIEENNSITIVYELEEENNLQKLFNVKENEIKEKD